MCNFMELNSTFDVNAKMLHRDDEFLRCLEQELTISAAMAVKAILAVAVAALAGTVNAWGGSPTALSGSCVSAHVVSRPSQGQRANPLPCQATFLEGRREPPWQRRVAHEALRVLAPRPRVVSRSFLELRRVQSPVCSEADSLQPEEGRWKLESHRWVQLALLSLLALLSDWVCFSTAAVPDEWMNFQGHEASELIDIFLCANVFSCFLYTDIADRFGLKRCVTAAAFLMASGCLIRSGIPLPFNSADELVRSMPSYNQEIAGTILVGLAQPFFQCSPPLLSATWFGSSERALATATAINFNQVGIATAFIVGGLMANSPAGIHSYFDVITIFAALGAVATFLFFRERPETPPSASTAAEWAHKDASDEFVDAGFKLTYPGKAVDLLGARGFGYATCAFVASIGCTNVVSTFTAPELARAGFAPGFGIDLAGAGFQIAIVLGGILIGGYVDRTKNFKKVVLACLVVATSLLVGLGVSEGYQQTFSAPVVIALLLALGASAGPVQPIAAELAVEVSYPCDENAVEATQQLSGNLFSALLVPICQWAASYDIALGPTKADMRGDTLVLIGLVTLTTVYFSAFDAPLTRSELDAGHGGSAEEKAAETTEAVADGEAAAPEAEKALKD